jgi:large subunit ribosomal protein L15
MNELSRLKPPKGSHKNRKRVGRGPGSGTGKTAGRGQKGQKARAAAKTFPGFEGGQMPLQRRLPKRGFTPRNRVEYTVINVVDLNFFDDGADVNQASLFEAGMLRKPTSLVKILGDGELEVKLSVTAHKFSSGAMEKIAAKGGTTEVLGGE